MFKFFRQYNKIILVVGGCVLMVAFLVPQAVEMFAPSPAKETIGTMHGEKVTRGQVSSAAYELRLLQDLPFRAGLLTDDEMAWMMIQADAKDMGLWASDREVDLALESVRIDEETLLEMADARRTTVGTIREVVRRWLIAEQYRQTVLGTAYRDPRGGSPSLAINRMQVFENFIQQQLGNLPPEYQQMAFQQIAPYANQMANGTRRLSAPLLAQFIRDNYAAVDGRVALVRPDTDAVPTPDDAKLQEVFETYKNNLPGGNPGELPGEVPGEVPGEAPGAGESFPFGYQYPDRVRLTALRIPMDEVRKRVNVEYLDVLDAYRANPQRFADEAGDAPEMPTPASVKQLTEELTDRQAEILAEKVVATVQSLIAENMRGQPAADGYLALTDDFTPLPWDEIKAEVEKEHGVTLEVTGDPDRWVAVSELAGIPGLGMSRIGEGQGVPFAAYVAATRELADDPSQILPSLRTQVGVASKPLRGIDGDVYFFRLVDAQPAHAPDSLDEVRDQVVEDATTIAAYEQLVADAASWKNRVVEAGLEAIRDSAGVEVHDLTPFQKVAGTDGEAPAVPNVGTSRAFVDAAFALVEAIGDPQADIAALPREQRVAVTPLPGAEGGPALAIYVLDGFEPLTRSGYDQAVESGASFTVDGVLDGRTMSNPLSIEAMAKRVGFDLESQEN